MDFTLFEARPGLALVLLPDAPKFTIVAATTDFVSLSGLKKEEIIGRSHPEFISQSAIGADEATVTMLRASYEEIIRIKQPHKLPAQRYDIINTDGLSSEHYWKVLNVPVIGDDGEITYLIHTAEDFTGNVFAETRSVMYSGLEKAYNIFMSAPVIIGVLKGDDYRIEMANDGLLEVWDRTSEVVGKPLVEAVPELGEQGFIELLDKVRITGEPFHAYEFPIRLVRNGKEDVVYFDFVYKPFYKDKSESIASGIVSVGHDVTERVLAKQKAEVLAKDAESQKRLFEAISGNTPDLIYVFGPDYRFVYANKALLNMWGLTWDQAIGKTLLENGYEPWHAEMHEREIDEVMATGNAVRGEVSFPHATLGRRIYDYILVPVFNAAGAVEAVAGTTRDITELKQAEQLLRESNERFRNLADESPIFVFIVDPDPSAPVTYWNKTWLEYTGQTFESALGRAWDAFIHPDDFNVTLDYYTTAFEARKAYFIPAIRVKRHDGEYRWHAFKGNPRYSADGKFNGYVGVGFDIHEQKIAEQALKESEINLQQKVKERTGELESQKSLVDNILKNSSNGISVTEMIRDSEGKVYDAKTIMANDAAVRYIGIPREVYLSVTAVQVDPNILESDYGKSCLQTLKSGEPSMSQYFVEASGRWQELTISKLDDDHLIHIFTDITPVKQAQLRLEQTIEELKRSNTNLEEFAYAASHDLKEPIRKIHVFSSRLRERLFDKLGQEDRYVFERMDLASKRMSTLIDDLLQYSYVSKGNAAGEEEVDLNEVVKIVLEDLDMEIEEKGALVSVQSLPRIKGHKRQLQQLFQNLLSNALKYNQPGIAPEVEIKSRMISADDPLMNAPATRENSNYHLIEIKDHGIGFVQEDADRIFNVFTRLHGNSEYKGSGVGLSIVRKVVENHNGQIWAEGRPGEGAVFSLVLPG